MIPPLVASDDTDLTNWQAGDQDTFLAMVNKLVTTFCGWHIAPQIPVLNRRCRFGERGYIMLPSKHVTEVSSVVVDGETLVADCDYFWEPPQPWLQHRSDFWPEHRWACVSFTSGFEDCPLDVKAVIFEVVATALELPASNATEIATMQYRANIKESVGVSLSDDQKNRLMPYKIQKFGGRSTP
jgi:hypothetical protein